MATTTHPARTGAYGAADAPARQVSWTRLGNALGYTDTEAKRAEIRDALAAMVWLEPAELADVLHTAPARQVVASLFYGRAWALDRAAVAALPVDGAGRERAVIGLASVTGERYTLLATGYEAIDLLHERPGADLAGTGVAR